MGGAAKAVKKVAKGVTKVVKKTASIATGGLVGGKKASSASADDSAYAAEAQRQTALAQQSQNMTRRNDPDASGLVMEDDGLGLTSLTGADGLPLDRRKLQTKNRLGGE